MKSGLVLLVILGSVTAFGQSPRKLNKQLRTQLVVEKHRQDSAYAVFLQDKTQLENLRSNIQKKLRGPLSDEEHKTKQAAYAFEDAATLLRKLGEDPQALVLDSVLVEHSYPISKEIIRPQKAALTEKLAFDKEMRDGSDLDQYKLKEQNPQLIDLLGSYQGKFKSNQNQARKQQEYIRQLEEFEPQVDSLVLLFRDLTVRLDKGHQVLMGKLKALEANYKLKGPKGFPEAYEHIFPDAHSIPEKKRTVIEFSEIDEEHDIVGMVESEPIQEPTSYNHRNQEPEIYTYVEVPAEFPGGMEGLKKYLSDHLVYPQTAKDAGITGKVFLQFVISDKGEISNVKIMRGIPGCPECDKEALRVVKGMPKWVPGKNGSKPVNCYYNLPIVFKFI